MAPKVFICYRRDDSAGHAGRVHDRLTREFGRDLLFMDVDSIPLGANFVKVLGEEVAQCDALLALLGPGWLDARDEDGNRRLENPDDFVRVEIATALKRNISVIPILLEGTRIPKADQLPDELKELALRNGLDVRHASFLDDMERLIRGLKGTKAAEAPPSFINNHRAGDSKVAATTPQNGRRLRAGVRLFFGPAAVIGSLGLAWVAAYQAGVQMPWPAVSNEKLHAEKPAALKIPAEKTAAEKVGATATGGGEVANCDGIAFVAAQSLPKCIKPGSGARFRECPFCPEMVLIPQGSFAMGTTQGDYESLARKYPDRSSSLGWEVPQSAITINAAFAVSVTHVTRGEFAKFAAETNFRTKTGCYAFNGIDWVFDVTATWMSPGFKQTDQHPVVCVSWEVATAYADWLGQRSGHKYRLMSESELEYIARNPAEPILRYFFGDTISDLCFYGNGADERLAGTFPLEKEGLAPCDDGFVQTAPVASYRPNTWGLYDVFGNVWTWSEDCWKENHVGAAQDGVARHVGDCTKRVIRGGSWSSPAIDLRAAVRDKNTVGDRSTNLGFRLARDLQ